MIRFPKPLRPGDVIAITAPSSGVPGELLPRLDLILNHLRSLGYLILEGECLRCEYKNASAAKELRARELNQFFSDPAITAIFPPWGGELSSELLALIDFEALKAVEPKWLLGYSDISTIQVPLTIISGWATAHGSNMMELVPSQTNPLTGGVLTALGANLALPLSQHSSTHFQEKSVSWKVQPDTPFNLTSPTLWKRLDQPKLPASFCGRLIGGCLDTIAWLAGSKYGDIPSFVRGCGSDGAVLYLENVEMAPPALIRALLALKRAGWFDHLSGLLIGRNAGPEPLEMSALLYADALQSVLGELRFPVIYDVDIGHKPPQLTLINGAFARVEYFDGKGLIAQSSQWPQSILDHMQSGLNTPGNDIGFAEEPDFESIRREMNVSMNSRVGLDGPISK